MSRNIIKIKDLNYFYPDNTMAISRVSLDIYEGESMGIIGPNGAGKTTLLLHLNGILKGKGTVEVFGIPVNDSNLQKIRRNVQIVFQDPDDQLFMPTVFDDIAFGPLNIGHSKKEVKELVRIALEHVEMQGYEDRCSHHLSFGEKKRIAIATCLAMKPEILILDEPSIGLDPRSRRHLIQFLKSCKITLLIASHDIEMVLEICSRVSIMDQGTIVDVGEPKKILSNQELLESHGLEMPLSLSKLLRAERGG